MEIVVFEVISHVHHPIFDHILKYKKKVRSSIKQNPTNLQLSYSVMLTFDLLIE